MKNQTPIETLETRIAPATLSAALSGTTLKLAALSSSTAVDCLIVQTGAESFTVSDDGGPAVPFTGVKSFQVALSDTGDTIQWAFLGARFKGPIKIDANGGSDSIGFDGNGLATGSIDIVADGSPTVLVNASANLTGPLKVATAGGTLVVAGQAGKVTASGIGTFILDSGGLAESIALTAPATGISATIVGTVAGPVSVKGDVGADAVLLSGRVDGKVDLKLGDGNNTLTSQAAVGGTFSVQGGIGNDSFQITPGSGGFNPVGTGVAGAVKIDGGDGSNTFNLVGSGVFGGAVSVKAGAGNDSVTIAGSFSYSGLEGSDSLNVTSSSMIRGKTTASMGEGTNTTWLTTSIFDGAVSVKGGAGNDSVLFGGATVNAKPSIATGDGNNTLDFLSSKLRNGLSFKGGSTGTDDIEFAGSELSGAISITAGNGTNLVQLGASNTLSGFTFRGGDGTDAITISPPSDSFSPMLVASIALGAGADFLTVYTDAFVELKADGGEGADTLTRVLAAESAGIDHKNFDTFVLV
jgi:hypothetical protein